MAKTTSAETGCRSGLTGEERTHFALMSGGQATHTAPPCDLCALWRQPTNPPSTHHASHVTPHELRLALVDDDPGTCLVVRQVVQAQRDGWGFQVYHAPCLVRKPPGSKGAPCASAPPGHDHAGSVADIVLIGLSGDERGRLACVRRIKAFAPSLPVLIISRDCNEALIAECCAAGADGYLLKPLAPEELARAVSSVAQGWPVLCREAQKAIMNVLHRAATATTVWFPGLTGREQEIAGCLVANLHDKEISDRLGMAGSTVHVHLVRFYSKLRVHNRQQAVARLLGGAKSNPF